MTIDELLTAATGKANTRSDLEALQHRMSDDARLGLATALAGRVTVSLGQAIGGTHNVSKPAADMLRRRALVDALYDMAGLLVLFEVSEEEIATVLGQRRDG